MIARDTTTATFGELLRHYRLAVPLSQETLAERARLSVAAVRALESGRRRAPRRDTVALLAAALELSPDQCATLARAAHGQVVTVAPSRWPAASTPPLLSAAPLLVPPGPLIGREREEAALAHLLAQAAQGGLPRLVTLTGPGGVGKTRLALAMAVAVQSTYRDGVAVVDLSAVRDHTLVATVVAQALGERETGTARARDVLIASLRPRHALLVLDNLEQVLDAAASLLADLLVACPRLTLLATSRTALRLRAEQQFPVPPLLLPAPEGAASVEDVGSCAAVQLFVARARAVQPSFVLDATTAPSVAAICRRLDGLPLAIELAAARSSLLPPQALLSALQRPLAILTRGPRDLPERQRTLRAVVDWSYGLLDADERRLFASLGVFAGGCTLDAVETIGAPEAGDGVLNTLASLADKSLLLLSRESSTSDGPAEGERRVGLLETIRVFALECLEASGAARALRRAHAEYYLELAEAAVPALQTAAREPWLRRLEREHENLRAALAWALEDGEGSPTEAAPAETHGTLETRRIIGLRLGAALWAFWMHRGHLSEGRAWLERLLAADAASGSPAPPAIRAEVLTGAGWLAQWQADFARATELLSESVTLRHAAGLPDGRTDLLINDALGAFSRGDYRRAAALLEESVASHRAAGNRESIDRRGLGLSLFRLGMVVRAQGDYTRATALYEECLALHRALADPLGVALALLGLGDIARDLGDAARVEACCTESARLFRALGDAGAAGFSLNNLALAAYTQGDLPRALAYATESVAVFRDLANQPSIAEALATLGCIERAMGAWERAHAALTEALVLAWVHGPRSIVAASLEGLAALELAKGRAARAAELGGAAEALRMAIPAPLPPASRAEYADMIAGARRELGDAAFAATWTAGTAQPIEQIVGDVLTSM